MTKVPITGPALAMVLLAVLGSAWAQNATETISVGDIVFVDVYRHPDLSTSTQVGPDGTISLPHVGFVNLLGMTESEASALVSKAFLLILKNPRVTVSRSPAIIGGGARTAQMRTEIVPLQNASAATLRDALDGMTSEGGSVSFDPGTNSLIITDTPSTLHNIMSVVSRLDEMESQRYQVRIEAKIADVQVGALKEFGVRWFVQGTDPVGGYYPLPTQDVGIQAIKGSTSSPRANEQTAGSGTGSQQTINLGRSFVDEGDFDRRLQVPVHVPTPGQMLFGLLTDDVDVGILIDALVADDKAELLANPNILTVNHERAEIRRIEEFPYTEFGTEVTGRTTFATKFLDLGIKLAVTPHVYRDQGGPYVKLELEPEVSFPTGTSNGVPIRSVRSSQTVANVRDGQTLVVGGIYRSDERNVDQGVPVMSKIPLFGKLFKRTERSKIQTELMVFVTPTVHETPESVTWEGMMNLSESFGASAAAPELSASHDTRVE